MKHDKLHTYGAAEGLYKQQSKRNEISGLHEPFINWLKREGLLYRRSRPDRKTSEAKGEPDFLVMDCGRVLPIEFKDKNSGKLSKDQVFRHAEYARAGCKVHVLRDIDSATELVTAWLEIAPYRSTAPDSSNERLEKIGGALWRDLGNGKMERVRNAL